MDHESTVDLIYFSVLVAEGTFAYRQNKPIIPVRCEHFLPTGWLGNLLPTNLYHEATSDEELIQSFQGILQAIEDRKFFSRVYLSHAP